MSDTPASTVAVRPLETSAATPRVMARVGLPLLLLGLTAAMCFYHLHGGAGFEPTDAWVAQTSREMYEKNEWITPVFSGETRMQKSPGPYWTVMAIAWLRGGVIDEVTVRIPNAASGVLLVATLYWMALRCGGPRVAIFTGFAASSSALVLYWSHRGASDLGLTALMTLSLVAFWAAASPHAVVRRRWVAWLVGYFAAGLAMIYKMPMPLVCVGLPMAAYIASANRWRVLLSPIHLAGAVLFALPWLPWMLAVLQAEPAAWAKWKVEFFDRMTGDLPNVEEQKRWYYYFYYLIPLVIYTLPYSASLGPAVVRYFRERNPVLRDGMWFALVWFGSLAIFFTLAVGKETRYFLPALPPLFLLLGVELAALFDGRREISPRWTRATLLAVAVLGTVGAAAGVFGLARWHKLHGAASGFAWPDALTAYLGTAVLFLVGATLAAALFHWRRRAAAFATLVGGMYAMWLWAWPTLMPMLVSQSPFVDFARQMQQRLSPEQQERLQMIAQQDPRIIWLSDIRYPRVVDQLELLALQDGKRDREFEERYIAEKVFERARSEDLALFVAGRPHYVRLLAEGGTELARQGQRLPPLHLWFQSRLGPQSRHYVVFGNRPPAWEEPALSPPSQRLEDAQPEIARLLGTAAEADTAQSAPAASGG